ncbi:phosphatidylglycerophosphatase A family protein [Halofilum ochraceum]|uniref:phosphatidylglycerophosphatase A family protein n=1 Tax=Halofilum ochraceum TaxID=1611323 RepID=UPI0008DA39C0|nr:phosphatidylglycerophosphatase A [Halofilum ochraceum]
MSVDSLTMFLATGMGLGHVPGLPGTAAAIAGAVLAVGLGLMRRRARLAATLALVVLAVPVCEYGGRTLGGDDTRIVADELLTFPIATAVLPVNHHPGLFVGVFLTSRILDGLKPPPARAAQRLHGGLGIMLDDAVSNLWSLALGAIGWRAWKRWKCAGRPGE